MKWEYLAIILPEFITEHLNYHGDKDWELVTVDQGVAYFKRPIGEVTTKKLKNLNETYYPERDQIIVLRKDLTPFLAYIDFDFPVKRILILDENNWPNGSPVEPSYKAFNELKE